MNKNMYFTTGFTTREEFINYALTLDNTEAYAYMLQYEDQTRIVNFSSKESILREFYLTERLYNEYKYDEYVDWYNNLTDDDKEDYDDLSFIEYLEHDYDDLFYDFVDYRINEQLEYLDFSQDFGEDETIYDFIKVNNLVMKSEIEK